MKKAFILFVLAVISICQSAAAQSLGQTESIVRDDFILRITKTETKGSPYLSSEWLNGKIILGNNTKTRVLPIRFNIANNTVEYKRNGQRFIIKASKINGFVIFTDKKDVTFKNGYSAEDDDINKFILLRVVCKSSTKLLAHHTAQLNKDLPSYGSATKKNAYSKDIDYYLLTTNPNMIKVDLEKDDIIEALNDKKALIKKYATYNKLDFTKEGDVCEIIRFYDK